MESREIQIKNKPEDERVKECREVDKERKRDRLLSWAGGASTPSHPQNSLHISLQMKGGEGKAVFSTFNYKEHEKEEGGI